MNEVPTYTPPEGVHGPTLGRDLPDGCERKPAGSPTARWLCGAAPAAYRDTLFWWRFPPFEPGDRVQLTGTVGETDDGWHVVVLDGDNDDSTRWFPTAALTRVVTP
jgi:hypothetical protein